jgi:hypothetical protein
MTKTQDKSDNEQALMNEIKNVQAYSDTVMSKLKQDCSELGEQLMEYKGLT